MASRKPTPAATTRNERRFWRQAFLAAEFPGVLRHGSKIAPQGMAHFSAEFADSAVSEYRRRFRR